MFKNFKSILILFISLCFIINTIVITNTKSGKDHYKNVLEIDAIGYYSYLPMTFVYNQDWNFNFLNKINNNTHVIYYNKLIHTSTKQKVVNQFFIGTALLMMPFYLIGTLFTQLNNIHNDGFTKYQILSICYGASFYLYFSFFFIGSILKEKYALKTQSILLTLLLFAFGTNFFYYSIVEPGMSHVYSFFIFSLLLFYIHQYVKKRITFYILIWFILFGLLLLIRPTNILLTLPIILIFYNDVAFIWKCEYNRILKVLPLGLILLTSIICLQLGYYKMASGHWFYYSYGSQRFYFLDPNFFNILFSYRKGLFIYMPLLFISILGIYYWNQFQPKTMYIWLVVFSIITYILSCWQYWSYGGCYGNRAFIEFYILFIIPLAFLIDRYIFIYPKITYSFAILFIVFVQIQTYQYRYNIIHWDEMNKEKYWKVFMRIDQLIK
jgi:hypothetical protein